MPFLLSLFRNFYAPESIHTSPLEYHYNKKKKTKKRADCSRIKATINIFSKYPRFVRCNTLSLAQHKYSEACYLPPHYEWRRSTAAKRAYVYSCLPVVTGPSSWCLAKVINVVVDCHRRRVHQPRRRRRRRRCDRPPGSSISCQFRLVSQRSR